MADKPTLNTLATGSRVKVTELNENFETLATAVQSGLGRGGTSESPNSMEGVLDMDLNKIQNLGAPSNDNDAVRLIDLLNADVDAANAIQLKSDLASTENGKGASLIGIEDSAGNFTSSDVEGALAELTSASNINVTPAGGISSTNVQAALEELDSEIGGVVTASNVTVTPAGGISSTNVQDALEELDTEKAPLASPTFTGDPKAPTPAPGDNDTSIATTAFVQNAISGISGGIGDYEIILPLGTYTSGSYTNAIGGVSWTDYDGIMVMSSPDSNGNRTGISAFCSAEIIAAYPTSFEIRIFHGQDYTQMAATSSNGFTITRSGDDVIRQIIGWR